MSVKRHCPREMLPSFTLGLSTIPWDGAWTGPDATQRESLFAGLDQHDC